MKTVYVWNKDETALKKMHMSQSLWDEQYISDELYYRIQKYEKARHAHVRQLDNECIGLAMLQKEGLLSRNLVHYIRNRYIYRPVPIAGQRKPERVADDELYDTRYVFILILFTLGMCGVGACFFVLLAKTLSS